MDSRTLMDTELRECSICIEATRALVGCMEYKQLYAVVPWIEKNYKKKSVTFFLQLFLAKISWVMDVGATV